jgi:capsular polysaccharide export protein
LEALLGQPVAYPPFRHGDLTALAVWGPHSSAAGAARLAARLGLPWFRVANGFLRPMGRERNQAPLAVVIDDEGIFEDAGTPSRLERLACADHSPAERERARKLIALWRHGRLSQFNDARDEIGRLPAKYVLVIDQPANRRALDNSLANPSSFRLMLDAALAEHSDSTILLKAVPRGGCLHLKKGALSPRVQVISCETHPAALLERAGAVYTVSSHLGFEALLWDRPVRTFGLPFFAGWGLTSDTLAAPPRRMPVTLEDLVHAAFVEYSRYRHPETGHACEVEEVVEWLALQRRMRERFPVTLFAAGFSLRKRRFVRDFLQGSAVRFVRDAKQAAGGAPLVMWGRHPAAAGRTLIRLEDGFLRSVGLGAGLVRPLSWAVDRLGIYYDSTMPSEMERLLETMDLDPELLARAARLRLAIVAGGVTKYNLDVRPWKRPSGAGRVILVPGQVENDASLRYGAPGLRTNLELLRAVRAANPEAFLVYKPHPDVVAGLRSGGKGEEEAPNWCDEQVTAVSMDQLLLDVDEVHVLTSLAGFEALLRGRGVTCHGQPFYAGWGLTTDAIPIARRTRKLSLDALVAVALILYPTYISRVTGRFTTPERVIEELRQWRTEFARRKTGPVRRLAQRLFHAWLRRLDNPR